MGSLIKTVYVLCLFINPKTLGMLRHEDHAFKSILSYVDAVLNETNTIK